MNSIPSLTSLEKVRLQPIKGNVPDPYNLPAGCGFEPRCKVSKDICREKKSGAKGNIAWTYSGLLAASIRDSRPGPGAAR